MIQKKHCCLFLFTVLCLCKLCMYVQYVSIIRYVSYILYVIRTYHTLYTARSVAGLFCLLRNSNSNLPRLGGKKTQRRQARFAPTKNASFPFHCCYSFCCLFWKNYVAAATTTTTTASPHLITTVVLVCGQYQRIRVCGDVRV